MEQYKVHFVSKGFSQFENDNFEMELSFFAYWYQINEQTICVLNVMLLWILKFIKMMLKCLS
jgi:hypothetical protein